MKKLYDYVKNGFTVAGTKSNKILIFDVDDTLVRTTAEVLVKKDGKVVRRLSSSEYNDYVLQDGEEYDYRQFDDPRILNKGTFTKYWETLKREYDKGTHISILTARNNATMIREFFMKNGIDIKQELVFAVGSPDFMYKGNVAERKSKTVKLLMRLGYDTLIFFDDNKDNLAAAKRLSKPGIKIHTVKA